MSSVPSGQGRSLRIHHVLCKIWNATPDFTDHIQAPSTSLIACLPQLQAAEPTPARLSLDAVVAEPEIQRQLAHLALGAVHNLTVAYIEPDMPVPRRGIRVGGPRHGHDHADPEFRRVLKIAIAHVKLTGVATVQREPIRREHALDPGRAPLPRKRRHRVRTDHDVALRGRRIIQALGLLPWQNIPPGRLSVARETALAEHPPFAERPQETLPDIRIRTTLHVQHLLLPAQP